MVYVYDNLYFAKTLLLFAMHCEMTSMLHKISLCIETSHIWAHFKNVPYSQVNMAQFLLPLTTSTIAITQGIFLPLVFHVSFSLIIEQWLYLRFFLQKIIFQSHECVSLYYNGSERDSIDFGFWLFFREVDTLRFICTEKVMKLY